MDLASELRPAHLQLLAFYDEPLAHLSDEIMALLKAATGKRLLMITESAQAVFIDWTPEYFAQIHSDLLTSQLLDTIALKTIGDERSRKTSQKGQRFLAFITEA